jgi:phage-related protein
MKRESIARCVPFGHSSELPTHIRVDSVAWSGAGARTLCETPGGSAVGDAHERQERDCGACYVTAVGKRVVVVHVFEKKTQNTPRREILTALKRAKEVQ